MNRRRFLQLAGGAAAVSSLSYAAPSVSVSRPDFSLEIGSVALELAPGITVRTLGYNGQSPGPLLRMREGIPVTIDVKNRTDHAEVVHWHGLQIGSIPDGATEEGSPSIAPGGWLRYRFAPKPAGTRWYHTHTMAMQNLQRATYTGQFGFLVVDPASEPGAYDQEIFLAVHHWEPSQIRMDESREGCAQVTYRYASFNDKLLGAGDPIRVRTGQRVLFRFLNASATEDVVLALPGHRFTVLALDGNPVPRACSVETLSLAVAERIDASVEMNTPGKWILGSVVAEERSRGLGTVIEYEDRLGAPQWRNPERLDWSYAAFSAGPIEPPPEPDAYLDMTFERKPGVDGGMDQWTINGASYPHFNPIILRQGQRYRLRMMNASDCAHPVHLHRHSFELVRVNQIPVRGVRKDTARLERYNVIEADLIADNPGDTLFHCHQQMHMDYGFMTTMRYARD